jgi:hypothetical protein
MMQSYLPGALTAACDSAIAGFAPAGFADTSDLQIIRDVPQVKTRPGAAGAVFGVPLGFKQLARGLHAVFVVACSCHLFRVTWAAAAFACGDGRHENKLDLENLGLG